MDGNRSEERLEAAVKELIQHLHLETNLVIPNAAGHLCLRANLAWHKIEASMKLKATQDSPSTKGRVGWLKRMLRDIEDEYGDMTFVTFRWVGKNDPLIFSLREMCKWKKMPDNFPKSAVTSFEVRMISDGSNSFQSPRKFIVELENLASIFYWQIGERLKAWVPKPPKIEHPIEPERSSADHH